MHIEHFLRGAETVANETSETSPEVSETSGGWKKAHVLLDLAEYMVNELKRDNTTNMDLRYFTKKA
jgi:hypothetical protein